jgi:hypothetical protein
LFLWVDHLPAGCSWKGGVAVFGQICHIRCAALSNAPAAGGDALNGRPDQSRPPYVSRERGPGDAPQRAGRARTDALEHLVQQALQFRQRLLLELAYALAG